MFSDYIQFQIYCYSKDLANESTILPIHTYILSQKPWNILLNPQDVVDYPHYLIILTPAKARLQGLGLSEIAPNPILATHPISAPQSNEAPPFISCTREVKYLPVSLFMLRPEFVVF